MVSSSPNPEKENGSWYDNGWIVALACVLFLPVGLYGLVKRGTLSGRTLTIVAVGFSALVWGTYEIASSQIQSEFESNRSEILSHIEKKIQEANYVSAADTANHYLEFVEDEKLQSLYDSAIGELKTRISNTRPNMFEERAKLYEKLAEIKPTYKDSAEVYRRKAERFFEGGTFGLIQDGIAEYVLSLPTSTGSGAALRSYMLDRDYGCYRETRFIVEKVKKRSDMYVYQGKKSVNKVRITPSETDKTTVYLGPKKRKKLDELTKMSASRIASSTCM
jgi:hypothetical protein